MLDQFSVGFLGAAKLFRVCVRDNEVAKKINQQRVEIFEAVGVLQEIAEQHVMFEEQIIVVSVFDKEKSIGEQLIGVGEIFAKKRAARFREHGFVQFLENVKQRLTGAAYDAFAV